ncbi:heme ABC exporter ATP-binding protein CcmA [Hellea balneolensis]|uniref:heme ABC exporter ATP-binding protein CcmA n=1 Tax=Hellea balneolensis TaxID=287478 RepID=UPI0003FE6765|nr:heme ABC exporter ATP-binding protein CcmA [Hellea balneolensis]
MKSLFPHMTHQVQLETESLALSRGDRSLIEELSFKLTSGDVLWTQGDNGIGKTTLLEALSGLRRPDHGTVSWNENGKAVQASRIIAYQPHKSYAKAALLTEEDLGFWANIYNSKHLVSEALNFVGLADFTKITTRDLSAGQNRRLALAKLIISQKPIWIMDEPAAAMDKTGAQLIDELISRHAERGGIAVIASHDTTRKLSAHTRKLVLRAAA